MDGCASTGEYSTPLTSVSRIQISSGGQPQQLAPPPPQQVAQRPLDKPTLVAAARPTRTSVNIPPQHHPPRSSVEHHSPPVSDKSGYENPFPVMYPTGDPYMVQQPSSLTGTPSHAARKVSAPAQPAGDLTLAQLRARAGNSAFIGAKAPTAATNALPMPPSTPTPPASPEKKIEVIPMNADKPTGKLSCLVIKLVYDKMFYVTEKGE